MFHRPHLRRRYTSRVGIWTAFSTLPALAGSVANEILVGLRRGRPALALVLRANFRAAVGVLGRTGQTQQAELADLHSRPQRDREVGDVGPLERDVSAEPRIDEAGRRVGQQAQTTE